MSPLESYLQNLTRRGFLARSGLCLGAMALGSLLDEERAVAGSTSHADPLAARLGPLPPRATHVIYLHMIGAPSQLDLFDFKPELKARDGQACPEELTRGRRFAFIGGDLNLAGSPFSFTRHGESGSAGRCNRKTLSPPPKATENGTTASRRTWICSPPLLM